MKDGLLIWFAAHNLFSSLDRIDLKRKTQISKNHSEPNMCYTGRRIKFASGKSLRLSTKKKNSRNSSFRIHFHCFLSLVFIPGSVEWIYKFPTAIFSQPIFLTSIWTALFEKETLKPKPPRLTFSKMPRMWKDKSAEMSCVQFRR